MGADKGRDPGSSSAEIGKYLDILAKDPNSRVFAPLAESYRKAGLLDDAVETALEGLKVHPNYLGGRVALGRAYFEKKRYAEAAAEMQKVATAAPDNIIAHKVLGQIADSQNDLPAAEKAFKMVLLLDPRDLEAQQFIRSLAGTAPAAPAVAVTPPPTAPPPPAPPVPSPPVSLPLDEIQGIEDIELQEEEPLDIAPDSWLPAPEPPAVSDTVPPAPVAPAPPVVAAEAVESPFEILDRPKSGGSPQSAKGEKMAFGEIDLESAVSEPPRGEPAAATESPFEMFSREPGSSAAPVPARTERSSKTGAREIEIETTAYNPPDTFSAADAPVPLLSLDEELPRIDLTQALDFDSPDEPTISSVAPETGSFSVPVFQPIPEIEPEIELDTEIELESGIDAENEIESESEAGAGIDLEVDLEPNLDLDLDPEESSSPSGAAAGRGVFDTETLASIYIKQGFYERAAEIYQRLIAQRPDEKGLREKLEGVLALAEEQAVRTEPVPPADTADEGNVDLSDSIEEPAAAVADLYETIDDQIEKVEEPVAAIDELFESFEAPLEDVEERVVAFAAAQSVAARPTVAARPGPELMISQLQTLLEAFKGGRPR